MPMETWTIVTGIALVDAINFPVLMMLIFVLGRPNALANALAYSAGMLGTHVAGGIVFAAGLSQLLTAWINGGWLSDLGASAGLMETGVGLLATGLALGMSTQPTDDQRARRAPTTGLASWFVIGFGITMTKLPIAVLYGTAMHQVATKSGNALWVGAGIAWYNLVAFLPFYGVWLIWLIWRSQSGRLLKRIGDFIQTYSPGVMKYGLLAIGILLAIDGIARVNGHAFLF